MFEAKLKNLTIDEFITAANLFKIDVMNLRKHLPRHNASYYLIRHYIIDTLRWIRRYKNAIYRKQIAENSFIPDFINLAFIKEYSRNFKGGNL